jgi:hypothetical protein
MNTGCTFCLHAMREISGPVLNKPWYCVSRNLSLKLRCSCTTWISNAQPPKRYGAVVANFKFAEMMLTCTCQVCINKKYLYVSYTILFKPNCLRHGLTMYILIYGKWRCLLWTVPNGQVGRDYTKWSVAVMYAGREGIFFCTRSVVLSLGGDVACDVLMPFKQFSDNINGM